MVDLLTVRQVQDILKVDRITIYRMLQDGRLRGSKIGQQWRFTRQEVERLFGSEDPGVSPASPAADATFPVHCIQTVQDLFSNVSRLGALVITPDGRPVTRMSNPCELCRLVQSTPAGQTACQSCWLNVSRVGGKSTCHAGLHYLSAPIMDGGQQVAVFLVGGFFTTQPQAETLSRLAHSTGLPLADLRRAALTVPIIGVEQHAEVEGWPQQAVHAVQSILQERTQFLERLQKIANLTQLA
jgi:excisionase family DNA binding protein